MKQGYVIAKNSLAKEFFISSSAYDRPTWTPVNEATVYPTAELADAASKKLYRNGSYSAKIVSLQELNLSFEPIDKSEPSEDELSPAEGDEDVKPEDEMTADNQLELCPDCEHEPCTCEDGEDGEDGDLDANEEDLSDDEFASTMADLDLGADDDVNGGPDENEQEADPRFDTRRMGMAQMSPMGSPRITRESATMPTRPTGDAQPSPTNTPSQKVDQLKFKDPANLGKDEQEPAGEHETRVKVPAEVLTDLNAAIAEYDREAENFKNSDDARASFAMTAADAMKTLRDHLKTGTVQSIKLANVHLSSLMSPIATNIPASVVKFVYSGGAKPSLKDLFNAKRGGNR
jgi:hypothetical protein